MIDKCMQKNIQYIIQIIGTYNNPTVNHVAAIIPGSSHEILERDIVLYVKDQLDEEDYVETKSGDKKPILNYINALDGRYDPLTYVMMFPYGSFGWCPNTYYTEAGYKKMHGNKTNTSGVDSNCPLPTTIDDIDPEEREHQN